MAKASPWGDGEQAAAVVEDAQAMVVQELRREILQAAGRVVMEHARTIPPLKMKVALATALSLTIKSCDAIDPRIRIVVQELLRADR